LFSDDLPGVQKTSHLVALLVRAFKTSEMADSGRVHAKKVMGHAALRSDLRSQKS
jgi:hypothetical protein